MTNESQITTLRHLIDGWYEASLSEADTKRLLQILTTETSLPEDLTADRDMILALHSLPDDSAAMTRSRERLNDVLSSSRRKSLTWRIIIATTAAAACIAIIATISFLRIERTSSTVSTQSLRLTASAKTDAPDSLPQKIIKMAKDTLCPDFSVTLPRQKVLSVGNARLAKASVSESKKTVVDTAAVRNIIRSQQAFDLQTDEIVTDLILSVQHDYATAVELMDVINESYSSSTLLPSNLDNPNSNSPLPSI